MTESGHLPDDSEDEKLRKSSLIVMSLPFAASGLIWGALYMAYGYFFPGTIPMGYGILSLISFIYYRKSKKYNFYRISQVFLILVLPFFLQLSLGGFIPSSAVIIWALISPLSAMVFFNTRQSVAWFVAYVILVIVAYAVNDHLTIYFNWNIEANFINLVFMMNIVAVSGLIYGIQYYFVGSQGNLKKSVETQAKQLKELDEIKSRFFANISHEFRTPLTIILGLVNKQISNPDELVDSQDSETIQRNASRLLQLINQLLDLSRLESGEIQLRVAPGDIVGYTKKMFSMFESMALNKSIQLMFNNEPLVSELVAEKVELLFDHEKLQKVLTNLFSNAVKFTPSDGSIGVQVSQKSNQVEIEVSNSGEGIPGVALDHVFDRFFQANAESTREYEGTGIGLALVKELVELHQGSIDVSSGGDLTTFTISLPLEGNYGAVDHTEKAVLLEGQEGMDKSHFQPIDSPRKKEIVTNETFSNSDKNSLEILVVEDNPDLRSYIKSILEKNYHVTEAVDGLDGKEKAIEKIPDLIISDVMMPRMDGYELCKELKTDEKTNHIPVILLTAKASQENKLEGLETGADDYLIKPFDEKELQVRIKNLIGLREKLQKRYQENVWLKPNTSKVDSVQQKFIEQIKEAVEKHINNDQFGVEDLGAELAMSRSQIHRKLKAMTDLSATAFIRNYRLHRAAEYLKNETGTITEIAYSVGFNSQTYFSSSFQELFGCSPSEYGKE